MHASIPDCAPWRFWPQALQTRLGSELSIACLRHRMGLPVGVYLSALIAEIAADRERAVVQRGRASEDPGIRVEHEQARGGGRPEVTPRLGMGYRSRNLSARRNIAPRSVSGEDDRTFHTMTLAFESREPLASASLEQQGNWRQTERRRRRELRLGANLRFAAQIPVLRFDDDRPLDARVDNHAIGRLVRDRRPRSRRQFPPDDRSRQTQRCSLRNALRSHRIQIKPALSLCRDSRPPA